MNANLATSIINSLTNDGAVKCFLAATDEQRVDMVIAYALAESKKIEQFQNTYLTNSKARQSFQANVLELLASDKK